MKFSFLPVIIFGFLIVAQSASAESCDYQKIAPIAFDRLIENKAIDDLLNCEPMGIPNLSSEEKIAVHSIMLSYGTKSYGASKSLNPSDMAKDAGFDCDNYAVLAGYFFEKLNGRGSLSIIGWFVAPSTNAKSLNHAQVYWELGEESLILDPTLGLVVKGSFDDIASGKPLKTYNIAFRACCHNILTALFP